MELKLETQEVNIILQALESLVIPVRESLIVLNLIKKIQGQKHVAEEHANHVEETLVTV